MLPLLLRKHQFCSLKECVWLGLDYVSAELILPAPTLTKIGETMMGSHYLNQGKVKKIQRVGGKKLKLI